MSGIAIQNDRCTLICVAAIVLAVVATFGRVCTHEFVGGWDDGPLIYDNPRINPPTAHAFADIWRRPHVRMYIPAVYTTWWALARVASLPGDQPGTITLNPWVFHTANLIVHTLAALFVFAIVRRLVRNEAAACAGALLFALHPLQTEPIAWATGMKDLLCGLLSLAALWQYLNATSLPMLPHPNPLPKGEGTRLTQFALATILLILALLAKPAAVVVPLIAFVIDVLLLNRHWRSSLKSLWPWLLLIVPCIVLTGRVQPTPEIIPPPLWQRAVIAADSIRFYLAKFAWPTSLGIDYGLRPDVIVKTHGWIATLAAAAAIVASRSRRLVAGSAVFLLGVFPVLGLTPFVFQSHSTVADRYVYLSMLGPAIVVAHCLARRERPAIRWIAAVVLLALASVSFVQAGVWSDSETLMRHALTVNPDSPVANNNLGDTLFGRGDIAGAYEHFSHAVRTKNDYLGARDNLAAALVRLGRADEAIDLMTQTLEMRRRLPEPIRQPIDQDLSRLAQLLASRGREAEAKQYLSELSAATRPGGK